MYCQLRWLLSVAAIAIGAMTMFGTEAKAEQTVKLGLLTPLSGTLAPVGRQVRWGVELAVDEVNAAGGILGRRIEIFVEDTESNAQAAARKAEKLYQKDGVDFITGTVHSGGTLAVGQVAARNDRLMATTVSFSTAITGAQCNPNVFRVNAHAGQQANAGVTWLRENIEGDDYLIVAPDYEMGHNAVSAVSNLLKVTGANIVDTVFPPLGAKDYSPYFSSIRAKRPDVLIAYTPGNDTVRLFTQMREYGLLGGGMVLAGGTGVVSGGNLEALDGAAEGFYSPVSYSPSLDTEASRVFLAAFEKAYGAKPDMFAADSYSVVYLLKVAAEKAGSLETGALRESIRGMSWATPQGTKRIRAGDHQAVLDMYITQVKGADFVVLDSVDGEAIIGPDTCEAF